MSEKYPIKLDFPKSHFWLITEDLSAHDAFEEPRGERKKEKHEAFSFHVSLPQQDSALVGLFLICWGQSFLMYRKLRLRWGMCLLRWKKKPLSLCMNVFPSTFYWSLPSFRIIVIRSGWLAAPCRAVILIRDVLLYAQWSWSGRLLLPTSSLPSLLHPSRAEEASRRYRPWEVSPSSNLPGPDNLM